MNKKYYLFFDNEDQDNYSPDDPPYRSAGSEEEARRLSKNWNGPNGLWFECELDKNDNPINLKPRPDIELQRKETALKVYTFREGDLVTGAGSTLGTYDNSNIEKALSDLKAYFSCVHFLYEEDFITEKDLVQKILDLTRSFLIKTNEENIVYIDAGFLNEIRAVI